MHKPTLFSAILALPLLATTVFAFGCEQHTFTQCEDGITHWYDPDDGQICDPLDCGGGRAPPKRNVPGCPAYTGTETRATSASYLSCWPFTTSAPSGPEATTGTKASVTSGAPAPTTARTGTGTSAPAITNPPTPSSGRGTPSASGSGSGGAPVETPNAANFLEGSLMVGAGAAVGALLLV